MLILDYDTTYAQPRSTTVEQKEAQVPTPVTHRTVSRTIPGGPQDSTHHLLHSFHAPPSQSLTPNTPLIAPPNVLLLLQKRHLVQLSLLTLLQHRRELRVARDPREFLFVKDPAVPLHRGVLWAVAGRAGRLYHRVCSCRVCSGWGGVRCLERDWRGKNGGGGLWGCEVFVSKRVGGLAACEVVVEREMGMAEMEVSMRRLRAAVMVFILKGLERMGVG
ncbi:hypothetical protein PMIN02_012823 [Paraphaeosphaeria minitans]